jgi:hypothetical protein
VSPSSTACAPRGETPVFFATPAASSPPFSSALNTPFFAAAPKIAAAQPPEMSCMTFSGVGPPVLFAAAESDRFMRVSNGCVVSLIIIIWAA